MASRFIKPALVSGTIGMLRVVCPLWHYFIVHHTAAADVAAVDTIMQSFACSKFEIGLA
jgi:hypothetical protein